MPRDWKAEVSSLTDAQKLVHLVYRMDSVNQEKIRGELLNVRRRAYEQELTLQAQRVGCNGRQGRLSEGEALTVLNDASKADAESIVNTYNYDLAISIKAIANEVPRANRNTYAKRLASWDTKRADWKAKQIAYNTELTARDQAQKDFMFNNGLELDGYVEIYPKTAAEPICQGLVNRGQIPMKEAQGISLPAHINCPHYKVTYPAKVPRRECPNLWMGG